MALEKGAGAGKHRAFSTSEPQTRQVSARNRMRRPSLDSQRPDASPPHRMSAARVTLLVFLGVFALGLAVFTRHNDFPFYYHPDEPGKVGQLTKNKRNLHHPLLMLTMTDLARRTVLWGEAKKDPQAVAVVGRWMTAAAAALAAASLAALATKR